MSTTREASGTLTGTRAQQVRVASVPAGHVYVRHLAPVAGDEVVRLPDPDPDEPRRSTQQRWWPPVMLRPQWAQTADVDVFHLQFGFDSCSPEELGELVDVLRRRGIPLVFTVHDLRNPHHRERTAHDAQLDVLVPSADAVLTLTPGAAAEIARRWGVEALVLPHPHVVDLDLARQLRERPRSGPWTVGLHVKSLRASMDPMAVLPTLVEEVAALPDARLLVNGHRDVLDDDGARRDAGLASYLRGAERRGQLELRVHDYLCDEDLWAYLCGLDVSVLPYRFGTHSGWLEACRDLGTTVVAPDCGYFADQGPVLTYGMDEHHLDTASLRAALRRARLDPPPAADLGARAVQRDEVAAAHLALYRRLLS